MTTELESPIKNLGEDNYEQYRYKKRTPVVMNELERSKKEREQYLGLVRRMRDFRKPSTEDLVFIKGLFTKEDSFAFELLVELIALVPWARQFTVDDDSD